MKKSLSIRQRILLSFALILGLTLLLGGIAFFNLHRIGAAAENVETDTMPGLYLSSAIFSAETLSHSLLQAQLLEEDEAERVNLSTEFSKTRAELDALISQYKETIRDDADRERFGAYKNALEPYRRLQDEVIRIDKAQNGHEGSISLLNKKLDPEFEKIRESLRAVVDLNRQDSNQSVQNIKLAVSYARIGMALTISVVFIIAFISGLLLLRGISQSLVRLLEAIRTICSGDFTLRISGMRSDEMGDIADGLNRISNAMTGLIGQVQKSSIQVNTSVMEMSATLKEQQTTANEVASTSVEVGATAKEISFTAKELGRTMSEVAKVADETAQSAIGGQSGLAKLESTMQQIMAATSTISAKLAILNEKTANINSVVTTINKVADQTNLLSLNAAIEAEKAGEYGRGFGVVATEIRRLADQTAVATYDIEQMVKEMQSAVSAGVMGMDKFNEEVRRGVDEVGRVTCQLAQIIDQVQALTPRFESANEGAQTQSTAAGQISDALGQLGDTAQQSAQAFVQNTEAVEQLTHAVHSLQDAVSKFKANT